MDPVLIYTQKSRQIKEMYRKSDELFITLSVTHYINVRIVQDLALIANKKLSIGELSIGVPFLDMLCMKFLSLSSF